MYEFAGDNSEDAELTEKETKSAEKKISEFLSLVAKEKLAMTEEEPITCFGGTVSKYFVRIANGVKYVDNGIQISFDAKKNLITSYNLNFTEAELADPKDAISQAEAYEKILEYSPIAPIYIMSGGSYKKAVSLEKRAVIVDAILGEIKNKEPENEYQYSDIDGHWAKDAAEKLAQIQIGISGGKLEPDRQMTQEEFLRLAASAVHGSSARNTRNCLAMMKKLLTLSLWMKQVRLLHWRWQFLWFGVRKLLLLVTINSCLL